MSTPLPRRALLRVAGTGVPAGLLLAVAGCTEEAAPPPPDPDRSALENALAVEEQLRDVATALPPDRQGAVAAQAVGVVEAHLEVLRSALGESTPSRSGSPSPSTASPVDLLAATDAAVDSHTSALRQASPATSPLLASLAASDAALAALVRAAR